MLINNRIVVVLLRTGLSLHKNLFRTKCKNIVVGAVFYGCPELNEKVDRMKILIRLWFLAFLCLSPIMDGAYAITESQGIGMVDLIQGEVYATLSGEKRRLSRGSPIHEGDSIETIGEGAVVVLMRDGTQWDIYDESKLIIEEYRADKAKYEILQGVATYSSGSNAEKGADVSIKIGDEIVYPEGTVISFSFVQSISIIRVVQGNIRVTSIVSQTTMALTVNQFFVSASSLSVPIVTTSIKVVTTTVVQILENTATDSPFQVATIMVTRVASRTTVIGSSISTQTTTETDINVITHPESPGHSGTGGGSNPVVSPN